MAVNMVRMQWDGKMQWQIQGFSYFNDGDGAM
jgi:hypothetical protein